VNQMGLFGGAAKRKLDLLDFFEDEQPGFRPRWYQEEADAAIAEKHAEHRSTLAVLATGLGKTVIFGTRAKRFRAAGGGDVLVLAHRDELVQQARDSLEFITGETVEVEKADERSTANAKYVVGSVQSFNKLRMQRLGRDRFGLVIFDEAHHAIAPMFRRPLDFFDAKILGVTATPDRGDQKAMAQVFESFAYVMGIEDGIEHGYLVPIKAKTVKVRELDLSDVRTVAGDLQQSQLDEATLKAIEGIVKGSIEHGGARQSIAFFPGVKSAEAAAARFNALKPGSAESISGGTPEEERRRIVSRFKAGAFQYLCNCNIATEGFDAPVASCIIQGRPTKSRALHAQIIGRGTRTLPGTIDGYTEREQGALRRAAIAASGKPDCLVLDFGGNFGRHTLSTPEDVLGGNYTEAEVALAKKKRKSSGGDVRAALMAARQELAAQAKAIQSVAVVEVEDVDPFEALDVKRLDSKSDLRWGKIPCTPNQVAALERAGMKKEQAEALGRVEASRLLSAMKMRKEAGLCSLAQLEKLRPFGVATNTHKFQDAARAINYIAEQKRKKEQVNPQLLRTLLGMEF
jgi:superfamily II DNA or RNA helicase